MGESGVNRPLPSSRTPRPRREKRHEKMATSSTLGFTEIMRKIRMRQLRASFSACVKGGKTQALTRGNLGSSESCGKFVLPPLCSPWMGRKNARGPQQEIKIQGGMRLFQVIHKLPETQTTRSREKGGDKRSDPLGHMETRRQGIIKCSTI